MNERLHIFDRRGERERPDAAGLAIERHHIVAARWAILKNEYLPATLIAQIEQFIACAPQKACEVEISGLEGALAARGLIPWIDGFVCS